MAKSSTDAREALADMLSCLKGVFGRYSRTARQRAWDGLQSAAGKSQVKKLLNSPGSPVVGVPRLLDFNEWLEARADDRSPPMRSGH
jgi:hypothetical protein